MQPVGPGEPGAVRPESQLADRARHSQAWGLFCLHWLLPAGNCYVWPGHHTRPRGPLWLGMTPVSWRLRSRQPCWRWASSSCRQLVATLQFQGDYRRLDGGHVAAAGQSPLGARLRPAVGLWEAWTTCGTCGWPTWAT